MKDIITNINGHLYIDCDRLLQILTDRDTLIKERIATPGMEPLLTERYRGQHLELASLITQITEQQNAS